MSEWIAREDGVEEDPFGFPEETLMLLGHPDARFFDDLFESPQCASCGVALTDTLLNNREEGQIDLRRATVVFVRLS